MGNFLQARSCLSTYHVPGAHLAPLSSSAGQGDMRGSLKGLAPCSLQLSTLAPHPRAQGYRP